MKFAEIQNLYWLWLAAGLAYFLWRSFQRRRRILNQFSQEGLIAEIAESVNPRALGQKNGLLVCGVLFIILALARPQWGYEIQTIKRKGTDILLVVDTSRSMLTADVKPNRLERTKLAVKDFLKGLKGDRVGLLAFAGDAYLVCPLTNDYGGFLLSLEDLNTRTVPRGGTNITAALKAALREHATSYGKYKAIIMITDGENLEEDPMPFVQEAKQKDIKIYCIGVGTKEGELIQVANEKGEMDFLKDQQGHFIKSRLNESLLQQIALATGGVYSRASGAQFGLSLIYDREISKFEKKEYQSKNEKVYFERFQIFIAIAMVLLLLEAVMTNRRGKFV